jgi:hypothetical protein
VAEPMFGVELAFKTSAFALLKSLQSVAPSIVALSAGVRAQGYRAPSPQAFLARLANSSKPTT